MKKLLLSFIISSTSIFAFTQSPTMNFETWTGTGTQIEPLGWVSDNEVTGFPFSNPQSVFKATSPDVHGGTYALKVTSVNMTYNPAPTKIPNPVGLAAIGIVTLSPPGLKFGFPNTVRPNSVSFWYKYAPTSSGDLGGFMITLTKWNTSVGKRDTIASGMWTTTSTVSAYTMQSVTLTYFLPTTPDTMSLIFSSTNVFNSNKTLCMNCGKAGSTLWVDDITFSGSNNGSNGLNEILTSNGVILYPNPANEIVNITIDANDAVTAIVYDAIGRIITSSSTFEELINSIVRKSAIINTSNLAVGLNSYSVLDKSGNILRTGKLSIVR